MRVALRVPKMAELMFGPRGGTARSLRPLHGQPAGDQSKNEATNIVAALKPPPRMLAGSAIRRRSRPCTMSQSAH